MITSHGIVQLLNSLVHADPDCMHNLTEQRVPCNQAVVEHPTVQVWSHDGKDLLGLLGVLNGIVASEDELIEGVYDDETTLLKSFRLREKVKVTGG